ncbi:MAG: hypothetical protein HDP34_01430 [Clostridia bacterium]|nr:hypothetical protein [Clostridia bacterium]
MQVYVELAILENFCMDFTLLYAAKVAAKNAASVFRIFLGACLGACFAVVFPLFKLGVVWSVVLKILSGLVICVIAGKFKSFKAYLKFAGAFVGFTALLGGALIGVFSLVGISYISGEGYLLSSVPIGIPLFGALLIIIGARKLAARLKKNHKNEVICRIYAGQSQVELHGFFDSGNKVYCRGAPVSVIPKAAAEKLLTEARITGGVKIHTVAGSKIIDVFTADKIEINFGEKTDTFKGVKIGVSPQKIDCAVLHPDLLEDINV